MNQDESPYPVWGMEVSYGGVFGKLFPGNNRRSYKTNNSKTKDLKNI